MKKLILICVVILPFFLTSCKKKPIADFSYTITYTSDSTSAEVSVSNSSMNAESYEWRLLRNAVANYCTSYFDENPQIEIHESGQYELILKAYNQNETATKQTSFTIFLNEPSGENPESAVLAEAPTASFVMNSSNGSYAPSTLQCTNTSSNAVRYEWTLTAPDNSSVTSIEENPVFTCTAAGIYTLALTAFNTDDLSSSFSHTFILTEPSTYKMTSLALSAIPMSDPNGDSWDVGLLDDGNPDIFFKIVDSEGTELFTSTTIDDVSSADFPVSWYGINFSLDYHKNFYIKFYDEDGALNSNDLMANCILQSLFISPGSSKYTWSSSDGSVVFTMTLEWPVSK